MNKDLFNGHDSNDKPSPLDQLDKSNPFSVPDGYFEELPEKVYAAIQSLPDFEKTAAFNPFTVPENYFERLPLEIQNRIAAQQRVPAWKEWLAVFLRPQVSLALASLAFVIALSIHFLNHKTCIDAPEQQLSANEIENAGYVMDVDEGLLVDALDQQNTTIIQNNNEDNSLEQYLIDNDVDINLLENKL